MFLLVCLARCGVVVCVEQRCHGRRCCGGPNFLEVRRNSVSRRSGGIHKCAAPQIGRIIIMTNRSVEKRKNNRYLSQYDCPRAKALVLCLIVKRASIVPFGEAHVESEYTIVKG